MNIVCDTSIILNFLKINRLDLLSSLSCWITDDAHHEITNDYPKQQQLLQTAIDKLLIKKTSVAHPQELDLFINLIKQRQLGTGECAAIAIAAHRGYFLAIDDNQAIKKAESLLPSATILRTQDILVKLIKENILDHEAANQLLQNWDAFHRFKLKIQTIQELFIETDLLQESDSEWGGFPLILKMG